jgi:subtilase family serine protease
VSFVLDEQDMSKPENIVEQGVRSYLSVSQFAQIYGQSQYNIAQLQNYLSRFGITTQVYPDGIDVNLAPPELPERLAQYVAAILGLSNYDVFNSTAVHMVTGVKSTEPGSENACEALVGLPDACNTPETFASNYGLWPLYRKGAVGAGQTIGIVTFAATARSQWTTSTVARALPASRPALGRRTLTSSRREESHRAPMSSSTRPPAPTTASSTPS